MVSVSVVREPPIKLCSGRGYLEPSILFGVGSYSAGPSYLEHAMPSSNAGTLMLRFGGGLLLHECKSIGNTDFRIGLTGAGTNTGVAANAGWQATGGLETELGFHLGAHWIVGPRIGIERGRDTMLSIGVRAHVMRRGWLGMDLVHVLEGDDTSSPSCSDFAIPGCVRSNSILMVGAGLEGRPGMLVVGSTAVLGAAALVVLMAVLIGAGGG